MGGGTVIAAIAFREPIRCLGHTMKVSPFAPAELPAMPGIDGVRFAVTEAGVKYRNRKDLLLAVFDPGTVVAGAFTRSKTASAPVDWCRAQMRHGQARGLVVNSGNANAFTGLRGRQTVGATTAEAARVLGCTKEEVLVASTGVIGQPLDPDKLTPHLAGLAATADATSWEAAARAIMTTDTYPKLATRRVKLGTNEVTLNGMAKGAGMIAPDLGTMFAFVFTDAAIAQPVLASMLTAAVDRTLNNISIDSDTSTSDTVLVFATGKANMAPIATTDGADAQAFAQALEDILRDLALQIVKDGEGLTKFLTLHVSGAENDRAARTIGLSIANSPLFKTALAGSDPNWGRIVMAVGKAGEAADRDRLAISFGAIKVAEAGAVCASYTEAEGAAYFKRAELDVHVDVGVGTGSATVWTCDLTADYVAINADYRS
jgi:glutamate N-acetyltransferase / amino-acid N-acetyltransferase